MEKYTIEVTPEEFAEIHKKREEKARQAVIEAQKLILSEVVAYTIEAIGLEETKRIIRAIHSDLRHASADNI
jgi:hypothetical protein